VNLTEQQSAIAEAPPTAKVFLHGPAGTGKSTSASARLRRLLASGVAGDSILVLTPQRTLQEPYLAVARSPETASGTEVTAATLGGLARRMCDLFWPLASEQAGFASPTRPPHFLTLETSQYYLAQIVRPLLAQGYFDSVTMDRNRLYSQILDSLNKSSAVGFLYTDIGSRLDSAWDGEPGQRRIYADAQDCATRFRQFCLQHNLLDFSLQLEIFWTHLWNHPTVHSYLVKAYRHLIYDNVEEDVPRAHDIVRGWLPDLDSALLVYDDDAGFRHFLGADRETGWGLRELCEMDASLQRSFVMSSAVEDLGSSLAAAIDSSNPSRPRAGSPPVVDAQLALEVIEAKFYPELLDEIVGRISSLIDGDAIAASDLVIVAPYLSDALSFAITSRLQAAGIAWRTHRPSRSLRDEPATRALLTLAALAHPHWDARPPHFDVSHAFMFVLKLDLVRAQLLTEIVYRPREFSLAPFEQITGEMQERITSLGGSRYSRLRTWIHAYRAHPPLPLDHFLRRLFGELLSQPGYGFHQDLDAARIAGSLVESARNFRLAMQPTVASSDNPAMDLSREYVAVLEDGILAAQYLEPWKPAPQQAILVAPAYSFLMANRPATIQFWLDPGSSGWFQRLDQPLTHTNVLSRSWPLDRKWTFAEEQKANIDTMGRLVLGLVRRCRQKIVLCTSRVGESGFEQRGPLLSAFQTVLEDSNATL
jgi:superfamily I DNA/RNA helicase